MLVVPLIPFKPTPKSVPSKKMKDLDFEGRYLSSLLVVIKPWRSAFGVVVRLLIEVHHIREDPNPIAPDPAFSLRSYLLVVT